MWAGAAVTGAVAPGGSPADAGAAAAQETTTEGQATTTDGATTRAEPTEAGTTAGATTVGAASGSAEFTNATFSEQRGDVAQFTVELEETDRARVRLGSEAVNYLAAFTVVDGDGDGQVTVNLNTFRAGLDAGPSEVAATGADEIRNYRLATEPLDSPLEAGSYDASLSVGGTETDLGTLTLNERSTGSARTWIAPGDADVDGVSVIREVATQNATVSQGDRVIVQVEASGLYGYVDETADLTNASNGLSFSVTETDLDPNEAAQTADLENATLVTDPANDQFFVVLDASDLEANSTFEATFEANGSNPLLAEDEVQNASTTFTVRPRTLTFDGVTDEGVVQVPAGETGEITGSTTLAPGSEFTVEVRSTGASPFLDRRTVTVGPNGNWNASLDFSEAAPGTNFDITVEEFDVTRTGVIVQGGAGGAATETTAAEEPATTGETTTEATTTEGETTEAETAAA